MVEFVDNINITRVHMKNAKFSFIQKTLNEMKIKHLK